MQASIIIPCADAVQVCYVEFMNLDRWPRGLKTSRWRAASSETCDRMLQVVFTGNIHDVHSRNGT